MAKKYKTPASWDLLKGGPGMGKSKLLKKLLGKKARKRWKKAKFKTFKPLDVTGYLVPPVTQVSNPGPFVKPRSIHDLTRDFSKEVKSIMDEVTPTSNMRFNVCAMDGTPIPDEVVLGNPPPWFNPELCPDYSDHVARREYLIGLGDIPDPSLLTHHVMDLITALAGIENADYQPVTTLTSYIEWAKDIVATHDMEPVTLPGNGDDRVIDGQANMPLPDNDGDLHSPAYYLEGFVSAHREYLELHGRNIDKLSQAEQDAHMKRLDYALAECDEFDKYVNRLFGYSGE